MYNDDFKEKGLKGKMAEKSFKKWDKILKDNLPKWREDYFEHIKNKECWGLKFADYLEFRCFKIIFKDDISKAIEKYKEETGEKSVNYDAFAYSMLEEQRDEYEKEKEKQNEFYNAGGIA